MFGKKKNKDQAELEPLNLNEMEDLAELTEEEEELEMQDDIVETDEECFDDIDGEIAESEEEFEDEPEEAESEDEETGLVSVEDNGIEIIYLDDDIEDVIPEKKKGLWWKILLGILGVLIVVYLGISACFTHFFYYNTTINGVDFSLKTVADVEAYFAEQVDAYELTLLESADEKEVITASAIDLEYQESEELTQVLKSQNPFCWYEIFYTFFDYTVNVGVEYDEELFDEVLKELNCSNAELMKEPVSAYPEYTDGAYAIVPEDFGSTLKEDVFKDEVSLALHGLQQEMDLNAQGCYTEPPYTTESTEIITLTDTLNKYVTATITYEEGDVVDSDVISTWLVVDDAFEVTLDEDAIKEYVSDLAESKNTVGKTRNFTAPNGKEVKVSGGSYGFRVDQSAEAKQIKKDILGGESVTRDIEYSSRAASYTGMDWGNTYAEVDLSAQRMWYIKDGKVVLDTPVVTGCVAQGHATPQGVYSLSYKQANKVLRGTRYPDGTYEYESPVRHWMPFNGGIGFHDADWRSSFGGSIYRSNGSHGCINMPIPAAKTLFGYITAGTPVVCHY